MALDKITKAIQCYKDVGLKYTMLRVLVNLSPSTNFSAKIKEFYNPYLKKNIYTLSPTFNQNLRTWEKALCEQSKIAIQIHVFYVELLDEIIENLNAMPYAYDLYISTNEAEKALQIEKQLSHKIKAQKVEIKVFPNKGRDVIPFLAQMYDVYNQYEYICHLHTKRSLHKDGIGNVWRKLSYSTMLGREETVRQILGMFYNESHLGIVFPYINHLLERVIMDWYMEKPCADQLWKQMGFSDTLPNEIIFPAGDMFWVKVDAVKQMFALDTNDLDVPEEKGQVNGTVMHSLERLWVCVAQKNGYDYQQIRLEKNSYCI